jgi:hypothetical protein
VSGAPPPQREEEAAYRRVRSTAGLDVTASQIIGLQPSVFGNTRKHLWTDFIAIVKGKHEIGPAVTS